MKKGLLFLVLIGEVFFLGSYQTAWAVDFSEERNGAWETFKQITIEGYKNYPAYGLVFDSASCTPDSNAACDYAVSEGQGYGLLLAAIQKDQKTFDQILTAADKWMWQAGRRGYGWKNYTDGRTPPTQAPTHGEEGIAM